MISAITGIIKSASQNHIALDIGSFECTLQISNGLAYSIGTSITLHVYAHWNSDNGPSFYGFANTLDRSVFTLLISCNGIGPKIGLAALDTLGAHAILEAIQLGTTRTLSSITGVGTKKAEFLIMHLKDKIAPLLSSIATKPEAKILEQWQTVSLTLESLNYSRTEITVAMDHLKTAYQQQELSFDQLLRKALTFLAK